jgi:hypothetical protein
VTGSGRLVIRVTVTAVLVLGAAVTSTATAAAGTFGTCSASGTLATCAASGAPDNPLTITAAVTSSPHQSASIGWSVSCLQGTTQQKSSGSLTAKTPYSYRIPHPYYQPNECSVVVTAALANGSGSIHLSLSSSSTGEIKGYHGTCADDNGNSSAMRAKIQIWTCYRGAAQQWTFRGGELVHHGMCMNDRASGGSGSKVILYMCNGAPNELWTHNSRGEYVLKGNGGRLCLDDPGYSTRNGTQAVVYTCNNGANQHWSLP